MLISDYFAEVLLEKNIDRVFLYPGGTIAPLVSACLKKNIKIEIFKNEQGAGYAALAKARLTGKAQVVMVTSGPGVTNTISPIADAYYDSTPIVFVTGQVGTKDLLSRNQVRQRGFQEVPTTQITSAISKRSTCLLDVEIATEEIPKAFEIAEEGRQGPVILDFPMNIQRTEFIFKKSLKNKDISTPKGNKSNLSDINSIIEAGLNAKRPVILLGQGALNDSISEEIINLKNLLKALVVTSFLGISSFNTDDNDYVGYIGHTGHFSANVAVHESDFLLVLGSRLDIRQTGTEVNMFVPKGKVAWINNDINELENPRITADWKINENIKDFLNLVNKDFYSKDSLSDDDWKDKICEMKEKGLEDRPNKNNCFIKPLEVMKALSNRIRDKKTVVVTGVGCHQHWAARHLPFKPKSNLFLSSGGHGTMGYDLPSAIGAAIALKDFRIYCVVGDGSLLMNIQELASLAERNLDVKVILINNQRLGIVSQFQLITWGEDPSTGRFGTPDFVSIAKGFSVKAKKIEISSDLEEGVNWINSFNGPGLLEVMIDNESDIVPMLMGGKMMNDMWMGRM